jgi:hypothetical protein
VCENGYLKLMVLSKFHSLPWVGVYMCACVCLLLPTLCSLSFCVSPQIRRLRAQQTHTQWQKENTVYLYLFSLEMRRLFMVNWLCCTRAYIYKVDGYAWKTAPCDGQSCEENANLFCRHKHILSIKRESLLSWELDLSLVR